MSNSLQGRFKNRKAEKIPLCEQFSLYATGLMGKTASQAVESMNSKIFEERGLHPLQGIPALVERIENVYSSEVAVFTEAADEVGNFR
mmetsp:Transcript_3857/g.7210  ORF Transcript_3857/g.7210 Transcript_3857/m.7210 type:complete len:88 (-) Transcript_3857:1554-1817(-)